ncbi:glycosyltransferase family 2 protein [Chryseolinea sp. T2]|uniref:glycosyltransferase family 2 protein n=1 Tax=Chryseolinea sp. T2 TaxID=3129255 RepID=UPI0030780877
MVSIVLVTYNRAKRLKLSIDDILKQTFQDFELIICDDCSPDNTESVCRDFELRDSRIKYYRHAENKQMPENLNFGIQQAQFEYVAILHDGDRFRKDLIEQWYNAMVNNENVAMVFNALGDSDSEDQIFNVRQEFPEGIVKREQLLAEYFRRSAFDSPVYGEAMVRKSLVEKYGYLKPEYSFYADVDFWMDQLHSYDAYYCADTLIKTPVKSFQPWEFEDDIVRFNVMLFDMGWTHRKKEFAGQPVKLLRELTLYQLFKVKHFVYILLLVTKNFPREYFMNCRKSFGRHYSFFLIWAVFYVFHPLLKPVLQTVTQRRAPTEADKAQAAKSNFEFS